MIIKLRTIQLGVESWTIIADIESVEYRRVNTTEKINLNNIDIIVQSFVDNSREVSKDYIFIAVYKNDKTKKTIYSNMVIYLLNEKGETVERIN